VSPENAGWWWEPMNYTGVALLLSVCLHKRKDGAIHISQSALHLQVCCENGLTADLCLLWVVHITLWSVMCVIPWFLIGLDVGKLRVGTDNKTSHPNDLGFLCYSRAAHFCTGRIELARETTLIQTQYEGTLRKYCYLIYYYVQTRIHRHSSPLALQGRSTR